MDFQNIPTSEGSILPPPNNLAALVRETWGENLRVDGDAPNQTEGRSCPDLALKSELCSEYQVAHGFSKSNDSP